MNLTIESTPNKHYICVNGTRYIQREKLEDAQKHIQDYYINNPQTSIYKTYDSLKIKGFDVELVFSDESTVLYMAGIEVQTTIHNTL